MKWYKKHWHHLEELSISKIEINEKLRRIVNAIYTRKEVQYGSLLHKDSDVELIGIALKGNQLVILFKI